MNTGPKLTNNNLVFGYDTGYGAADNTTATRFYPGKPCVNLWGVNSQFVNHTDVTVGDASIDKQDFGDGKIGVEMVQVGTGNIVSFAVSNPSVVSGGTYSWSSFVHSTSAGTKVKSQVTVYVNGTRHWLTNSNTWQTSVVECNHLFAPTVANEWHRVVNQFTMPSGTLTGFSIGGWYRTTSNFTFKVANCQFELSAMATPFTTSSRSDTASLIDLTKTANIDVSGISFDSNAQPVWDGTDDRSDVTSHSAIEIVDNVSIEYVYKRLSTDPVLDVIANKYHSTGWELFCTTSNKFALAGRNGDGTYYSMSNGAYTIQNNQYYHLVAMKEGLSWRLYVNGELYASLTANSIGTWSNTGVLQIGGEGNGYFPNMELPVLKVHNSVLSATEIADNFNAYKNRFDIQ